MIKAALIVLCLAVAVHSWDFDLSPFGTIDPTDVQMQGLYDTYMKITPFWIQSTEDRRQLFSNNVLEIIHNNRNPSKTWTREVNLYTGMSMDELRGFAIMEPQVCEATFSYVPIRNEINLPASFDWRDQGVIAPVKGQGDCAASWAFAASAAIESHWAIFTNSSPVLMSEQQLLDCSSGYNNNGCTSGLPSQAYEYVADIGGIDAENTYPYLFQADSCVYNASVIGAQVPGASVNLTAGDENGIMDALVNIGPVSVVFDATADFLSYTGGVYVGTSCGSDAQVVNQAALIVGYGTDSTTGLNYWICKNSWGLAWGEAGYFRIQKGVNMCGIADCASYPGMTASIAI